MAIICGLSTVFSIPRAFIVGDRKELFEVTIFTSVARGNPRRCYYPRESRRHCYWSRCGRR